MLRGQEPTNASVNTVRDVPAAFKDWVKERSEKIETARNLPYFIRDNQKRVDRILGKVEVVKKSPLEIAKERHDARTPEQVAAIQVAWSNHRVENLRSAIDEGLLPKECAVAMDEIKALIDAGKFDEANARIAFYQQRATAHAARTPKEGQEIKEAWAQKLKRDETTRLIADNVLKVARDYAEVDFSTLQKLIAENNLTKMREEARNVAQAVKAMRDEEKALSDLIPNAHEWHKSFTLAELKEAHAKIQATLDYWKAKGYDLATDSNLSILKTELEQKIQFVETPGAFKAGLKAHKTWQVQQDSYIKLLDKVENRIEIIKLDADYNTLLGFKTTSKDFKDYMAKAKAALDAGDPTTAKHFINSAESKKKMLEGKRKGKTIKTSDEIYSGFTTEQMEKAQELEAKIMDFIPTCKWTRSELYELTCRCDEYANHILDVSADLFTTQTSVFSAAEHKAFTKKLKEYFKETPINPNWIWGDVIGGVYNSMRFERQQLAKDLFGRVTEDELSLITRFTNGMTFYNAYNLRKTSPLFREIWKNKLRKLSSLSAIRDQYRIIEEYTQGLNSVQDRMMRYRGVTFRAVHSEGGKELLGIFEDCWKNNRPWKNTAAASTSTDISVPVIHFDNRKNYDVIMIIRNKTGCYIRPISEYDYEKEVMIIKDREYKLLKKPREVNGKYIIELEEL